MGSSNTSCRFISWRKPSKPPKTRENTGDQVVIGASFASDWLRERERDSRFPDQSQSKVKRTSIQLKIASCIFFFVNSTHKKRKKKRTAPSSRPNRCETKSNIAILSIAFSRAACSLPALFDYWLLWLPWLALRHLSQQVLQYRNNLIDPAKSLFKANAHYLKPLDILRFLAK